MACRRPAPPPSRQHGRERLEHTLLRVGEGPRDGASGGIAVPSPAEPGGDGGDVDAPLGAEAHAEDVPFLLAEGDGDFNTDDGAGIVDESLEGVLPGGELPQVFPLRGDAGDPCLLYTSDAADDLLCVDLG